VACVGKDGGNGSDGVGEREVGKESIVRVLKEAGQAGWGAVIGQETIDFGSWGGKIKKSLPGADLGEQKGGRCPSEVASLSAKDGEGKGLSRGNLWAGNGSAPGELQEKEVRAC